MASLIKATTSANLAINALKNDNQDVQDWFRTYDRVTAAIDWDYEMKAKRLPNYLRGQVLDYWEDLQERERIQAQRKPLSER